MLPNNFDDLARSAKQPQLVDALVRIGAFIRAHPKRMSVDTRQLTNLYDDRIAVARAIVFLVDAGVVRQLYAVTTPSGSLAPDFFIEPADIPERLPDRFNVYFETADQDIVPVLVPPA